MTLPSRSLFGGSKPWHAPDWTASDDRVRGGSSQSHLTTNGSGSHARFHGLLDTQTLGGAGFASQRTTAAHETWDLSGFDGIELLVRDADQMQYTFNLKDSLPGQRPDGRDESSVSWEADFVVGKHSPGPVTSVEHSVHGGRVTRIRIPWSGFAPTFRGRKKTDAPPLRTEAIRRFSIMCRSFFEQQRGPFSITLVSIAAYSETPSNKDWSEKVAPSMSTSRGWLDGFRECLGFRSRGVRL